MLKNRRVEFPPALLVATLSARPSDTCCSRSLALLPHNFGKSLPFTISSLHTQFFPSSFLSSVCTLRGEGVPPISNLFPFRRLRKSIFGLKSKRTAVPRVLRPDPFVGADIPSSKANRVAPSRWSHQRVDGPFPVSPHSPQLPLFPFATMHSSAHRFQSHSQLVYHTRFMSEAAAKATAQPRPQRKLVRVSPRGFCAGVVRAVEIVERALEIFRPPVYVHHEIVHNRYVVDQLRLRGAIFVESVEEVPNSAVLIFSAHGVPPAVRDQARARGLRVIDATCPLVTKVHMEALRFARENRTIILIGHRDHQEIVGTSGEAPRQTVVVDSVEAVDALEVKDPSRLSFLTQTTLSLYDTQEIVTRLRERFPSIEGPASDDICYATQNRQEAVEQLAREVELILVVGSPNSSNSNRLVEVAKRSGVPAELIDDAMGIDPKWLQGGRRVGLTAGASAPEVLVEQVSQRLAECGFTDQRDLDLIREDVRFTLPPELATIAPAPRR